MLPVSRGIIQTVFSALLAGALIASAPAQPTLGKTGPTVVRGESIHAASALQTPPANEATKAPPSAPDGKTGPTANSATNRAPDAVPTADASGKAGEYLVVDFEELASFNFTAPDTQVTNQTAAVDEADKYIPPLIKRLDGKKVLLRGFMLPLKFESDQTTEFLLMRSQATCCFGAAPKINEMAYVKTINKGVKPLMDVPLTIKGTLHVSVFRDNGYITGIYRMDGEKMIEDAEH
jgi:hypothetical protein